MSVPHVAESPRGFTLREPSREEGGDRICLPQAYREAQQKEVRVSGVKNCEVRPSRITRVSDASPISPGMHTVVIRSTTGFGGRTAVPASGE